MGERGRVGWMYEWMYEWRGLFGMTDWDGEANVKCWTGMYETVGLE